MHNTTYTINHKEKTNVIVGKNSITSLQNIINDNTYTSCFIVCDITTQKLFAEKIKKSIDSAKSVHLHPLPTGEDAKQSLELMRLLEHMLEVGLDKKSVVIALGGGVVGDIATVAAALFYRGIDCIQIPTTLLAQVDASIGGKGAVNMRKYKNMLGIIKQPNYILIDTTFLENLPKEQYTSGMGEIVKYAIALDTELFALLNTVNKIDEKTLITIISQCITIKMQAVEQDPLDKTGIRATLNFGHTIGHAVELTTKLSHGQAVGVGITTALLLSEKMGLISHAVVEKGKMLLQKHGLPTTVRGVKKEEIIAAIKKDKKTIGGIPKFILLEEIGKAKAGCEVPQQILEEVLEEIIV